MTGITELESFRAAFDVWQDKTDWVQNDRRFDVLKPWGMHRADVLKAYIEHLESRTVKLPVGYTASSGHPFNEAERTVMIPGGGDWLNRFDVEHVLTAAGIKWEVE